MHYFVGIILMNHWYICAKLARYSAYVVSPGPTVKDNNIFPVLSFVVELLLFDLLSEEKMGNRPTCFAEQFMTSLWGKTTTRHHTLAFA